MGISTGQLFLLVYPQCRIALCFKMRWNKGLKALPDYSFLFILFFSRLFFTASVVFHCNPPEGHFMYICWWGERGLYVYSFRCCVRGMRTSHRLIALNGFSVVVFLFSANCLDWCIFFLRWEAMFFSFPAVLLFVCAAICRSRLESDDVLL